MDHEVETRWTCESCHSTVVVRRPLRVGESAAESVAATLNDVTAVEKNHDHQPKED